MYDPTDVQRGYAGQRAHGAVLRAQSFRTGGVSQGNEDPVHTENSVNLLVWGLTEEGLRGFWAPGMFYVWT